MASIVRVKKEVVSFSLDKEIKSKLEKFTKDNNISKSNLVNKIFYKLDSLEMLNDIEKLEEFLNIEKV